MSDTFERIITIEKTRQFREKPAVEALGFGRHFTDHMFTMDYDRARGWHDARITPYAPLVIDPSAIVFHYGQAVFEGIKAFKTRDDRTVLFRPEKYLQRMTNSIKMLCIPEFDAGLVLEGIKELVGLDREWVPDQPGTSLYLRPFIIATDPQIGVKVSETYKFMVIMSPVGAYFAEGFNPVKIFVSKEYVRAIKGGLGDSKTPANYAASLFAAEQAKKMGYSQVLWLDAVERKYIDEVGQMNIFFRIRDEVVTPALEGSILPGVTRDSVIELLKNWAVSVSERRISIDEVVQAHRDGRLMEAFGTGTAAVISPVGQLKYGEREMVINSGQVGEISNRLYQTISGIQYGESEDLFGWNMVVD